MKIWMILPLLLSLCACSTEEEPLAPPPQQTLLQPVRLDRIDWFASMNCPNAEMYFVRDISSQLKDNAWRWTGKEPTLRFRLPVIEDLSFTMDFALPELGMRETGPVTITIRINGQSFAAKRFDSPGQRHFEQPVPSSLLRAPGETIVAAGIDKLWHTRVNGNNVELGFIIVRAGFVQ